MEQPKPTPPSLRRDARDLLRTAIPTGFANLLEYLPVSLALWFVGRQGDATDIDGMALGRAFFNVACFSTTYGLISAMRTLCPQAVGANKGKELHGLYAQRALVVVTAGGLVGATGIAFAEPILHYVLGQPRLLARRAQRYGLALLPSLAGIASMTIVQRVMTAEGHVNANFLICLVVCLTAPVWQWYREPGGMITSRPSPRSAVTDCPRRSRGVAASRRPGCAAAIERTCAGTSSTISTWGTSAPRGRRAYIIAATCSSRCPTAACGALATSFGRGRGARSSSETGCASTCRWRFPALFLRCSNGGRWNSSSLLRARDVRPPCSGRSPRVSTYRRVSKCSGWAAARQDPTRAHGVAATRARG